MDIKQLEKGKIAIKKKKRFRSVYNRYMLIFIFLFIVGYGFFFSTKVWFDDTSELVAASKLNMVKVWNKREVQLLNWEYSDKQKMMEIQVSITNKSYDGIDTYKFKALEKKKGYLTTEVIVKESGFFVVRIKNIPMRWSQIALFIDFEDETMDYCKFFTNKMQIAYVDKIEDHTYNEYMIIRLDSQISMYEEKIADLERDIEKQNQLIQNYEGEIENYQKEKEFQTKKEQDETDRLIMDGQGKISSAEAAIDADKQNIEEYQERIRLSKKEKGTYE